MNFSDFTKLVEEKISDFLNYEITNKGKTYIWIGKTNGKIGNLDCHYEIIEDSANQNCVNTEIHFEKKAKNKFIDILCRHYKFVSGFERARARININPIKISEENIKTCFNYFNEAENTVGTELEKIQDDIYLQNILKLINAYKNFLKNNPKKAIEDEIYKWKLLEKCEGKSTEEIISATIKSNVVYKNATMMFSDLLKKDKQRTCSIVEDLFDENITFEERFNSFKNNLKSFCSEGDTLCENDERTAVSLLTCKYPEKYIFFKPTTYESLCNYLLLSKKPAVKRVEHYLQIIHDICNVIESETDLLSLLTPHLQDFKTNIALISQTILWVTPLLKESGDDEEENMENKLTEECKNLLLNTHNLILHGAPGTGKTHLAKNIAAQIICSKNYEDLSDEEKESIKEQIGFVQFHPSYDYTDFVEGLRPVKSDSDGNIGFKREDGIFKKFCKKAIISQFNESLDYTSLLGSTPTVWKISLEGTGDNKTRSECMENNHIRIGWSEYGDIDISTFTNYSEEYGGSGILKTFANKMQIGDIVLSCYTEWTIDAIGIVTSDYYYDENGGDYPRFRDVKWIIKGLNYDIRILNKNKRLTLASVYKLNISYIDVLKIIDQETKKTEIRLKKDFIFIIDEINRGELSKIFGELFYNIDPGYRGENGKIATQYQNLVEAGDLYADGFFIPPNVYIIGTMNDIDRSVESMDFAFRRRFTFKEITVADTADTIIDSADISEEEKKSAKDRMTALNDAIFKKIEKPAENGKKTYEKKGIEGLSSAYHIGGAYFKKLETLKDEPDMFGALWNYHLEGLLREYLRGMEDSETLLEDLHKAYNLEPKGNQ